MLIPNQKIQLTITTKNMLSFYQEFYPNLKMRDKIEIPIDLLQKQSCKKIQLQCDICGKTFYRSYNNYLACNHSNSLNGVRDTCKECCHSVASEVYKHKTGYNAPASNPEVKKKAQEKYYLKTGYLNSNQNPEVKKKKAENYYAKTGYRNPSQNPEVQRKKNETYYNNTGYKYCGTSPEDRKKAQNTYYEKTGYLNPMQNPKNAGRKSSSMCNQMIEIIEKHFNNVQSEVPFKRYSLDCVVNINDCKIDIEYDGWFFHKDKVNTDLKRNQELCDAGIKVLRVKSGSLVPDEQLLVNAIINLSQSDLFYDEIILKDWEYRENNN